MSNNRCRAGAAPAESTTWQPGRLSYNSSETLFAVLDVYRDVAAHSAAMNMAIDEALLEHVTIPLIRFYRWQSPALSFGYFGRFADVASYQAERDLVRRWTGGGIVFHGKDLTYSIVIPANDAAFAQSSVWIYERIHRALCEALVAKGLNAIVAGIGDPDPWNATARTVRTALSDASRGCFANPVRADVVINGGKVAGAAQRRRCCGLLQQGSIQEIDLGDSLTEQFVQALCANCCERNVDEETLKLARKLAQQKYSTESWLRKR